MRSRYVLYGISFLFLTVFALKMALSVAPLFVSLDKKSVNAVIMQLEHDNDTKKNDAEKELEKEKKNCDESFTDALRIEAFKQHISLLQIRERTIYARSYHPRVPTPPPNLA